MATYLQGVTDYIPEFQPFQPDLNFYANVMQTKQSQYDSNWNALNKMYGQYFYADLTRDGNVKKKDELIKNIDFNLKRISQLDLSLEQNVNQATQVFKPFYEDKNLMKDMAWTKNYNSQVGKAEALRGSADKERSQQFWDTGLRELQYRKDEFKNATDSEAMSFGNVAYTPYVNSVELAQKIAKDSGLSIESVDFSPDKRWIITQKNGEKLKEPLSKLFEARLGSDPQVQAVYKTQAYVNRKDYAYSNAAQFNGDKEAAEMKYLEDSFNILKEQNNQRYKAVQDRDKSYDDKIKLLEKQIADKKAGPDAQKQLDALKEGKEINGKILERVQKQNDEFSKNSSSTPSTTTGFVNPYGDINSLRWKVDGGMASMLMAKDLNEAAEIFAYRDAKTSIKENPYAVLDVKHAQAMQQIHTRGSYSTRAASIRAAGARDAAKIRNQGEAENLKNAELLKRGLVDIKAVGAVDDNGKAIIDPNTGQQKINYVTVPKTNEYQSEIITEETGEINPLEAANKKNQGAFNTMFGANGQIAKWMEMAIKSGNMSNEDAAEILNSPDVTRAKGTRGLSFAQTLQEWMYESGSLPDYKGVKTADPEGRRFKAPVVTPENLGKLTAQDIYNIGQAQKAYTKEGLGFYKPSETKLNQETANYYTGMTERLSEFIKDNSNLPYIQSTAKEIMDIIKPAQFAAVQNNNYEDWKFKFKEAIIADNPGAEMLFDENNELVSKKAINDIVAKSVYDNDVEPNDIGFFEAVKGVWNAATGNEDDPIKIRQTANYWKSLFSSNNAPPRLGWLGETWTKYSPYFRGAAGLPSSPEDVKDYAYVVMKDQLEEAYDKTYGNITSSEWLQQKNLSNIPGIGQVGEGGAGFSGTRSTIQVLPLAVGTKGFMAWQGFVQDFKNIGQFDGTKNAILFGGNGIPGTSISATELDGAEGQTAKGFALMNAMIADVNNPNSEYNPFTLKAQSLAQGSIDRGAMVIMPDAKWLEQFKSSNDKQDNNLLTTNEYNAILQNGISVISDLSNFNNPAMNSTTMTPLESIVNYTGSYEEKIPGAGTFKIEKNTDLKGVSPYITSTEYQLWNPNTNSYSSNIVYESFLPKDRMLDSQRQGQIDWLYKVQETNNLLYNGVYDINY